MMNSTEQTVFCSAFNTASRSVEFNSNGLKIMVNTPKCCKKVIINEKMLENEIQSCDTNCFDKECNGKIMTCESECSDVQETINNLAKKGDDNAVNANSEMSSEMRSVLRKKRDGNVVSEGNCKHSKILIDKSKNLKILVDKSVVDNYVLNDKVDNKLTGKLCESSGRSEMTSVQHVTSPKDSSSHKLAAKPLEGTKNCDNNKDIVENPKSIVAKNGTKFSNASKNLLIGKDTKVIVRTFNINTKRHIPDGAQKTGGIIFPSKCQTSNNSSVNFDTKNIVSSNQDANRVLNLDTQNTTLLNHPQPVKLNWNSTNNEYFIIKDLPWKRLQPKDPSTCPYCSRCLVKSDAQTQTDLYGTNNKSGIIIGRVDLDSGNFQDGAVKYIKKDMKNVGKLVYVNRGKIVNGYSNNVNNYRKILPHSPFRIIYRPDFINEIRKENLDVSNMSDSHSSEHVTITAGKNLGNASCLLNGNANGSSEVVTGQMQTSAGNTHTHSLSDSSQDNSSKNVNQGDSTDQHVVYIVNESDVSSEGCSEENVIIDLNSHNCDYKSKASSVQFSTSNHMSGINSCKDNLIESDISSCKANLVEGGVSSCKDNLVEAGSCNTSLSNSCETLTIANSLHGMEQHEYLRELGNLSVPTENNARTVISKNHKNSEEIYKDNRIEDSCSADKEKTAINQNKCLNSVMWAPSLSVVQKNPTRDEIRSNKLMRTMYEDWLNCQKEDEDGNLPLHKAVLSNNIATVTRQTIILKALEGNSTCKAVNHQNREGYTALMIAAGIPDIKEDIVAILVHKFHVDQTVRNKNTGNTALHIAASSANIKCVMLLLSAHGAKEVVNLFNDEGLAPLHLAARHGHSDIIRELVDSEAEINLKDKRGGYTPLYHAWNGDHKDACNMLIGLGAECSDAYFPDQLSIPGSDSRASESALLISGRKRKQKVHTDKSPISDKSSDGEYTSKKRKM